MDYDLNTITSHSGLPADGVAIFNDSPITTITFLFIVYSLLFYLNSSCLLFIPSLFLRFSKVFQEHYIIISLYHYEYGSR